MVLLLVKRRKIRHYHHHNQTPMAVMEVTVLPRIPLINILVPSKQDNIVIHSMDKAISISTRIGSIHKVVMEATTNGVDMEEDIVINFVCLN